MLIEGKYNKSWLVWKNNDNENNNNDNDDDDNDNIDVTTSNHLMEQIF